jgi:hypothetical protein
MEVVMRGCLAAVALSVVAMVPTNGNAQVYSLPTPAPEVTAASADWQIQGEPVFYAGTFYYPTGPSVYFDSKVMVRTSVYRGVPLYVDATVDPYGIVYVPIGGNVMRPYERLRDRELTGTVGNRPPSFPIERDVEASVSGRTSLMTPPADVSIEPRVLPESERAVGTRGFRAERPSATDRSSMAAPIEARPGGIESIPAPRVNDGVWIEFEGTRYYSAGEAVPYAPNQFTRVGDHRGFPVYREVNGPTGVIFIASVKDGPLAPFRR